MTQFLTDEEVIAINVYVIREFSPDEQTGVKLPALLNSAVNRPKQSAFGEDAYPTIYAKAAAFFESLAQNHAFHNANKRTAFLSLLQFLGYNGYTFMMEQKDAEDFVVDVVNHKYTFEQIVEIIESHSHQ
ncbi:type II toxin-antitoxin system death-on-curing family toxin (plasmid) [Alicyclobacillus fastidiosus]|uniref:Type II toxin-antitoxin system death-on-curing family toxin n=1 Tax=Alicyclobacillus fastidiosus TaxID=392011 RepID=A0ABY6ZQ74_9BACL|nr:type II toxin-antitoxin system death-on-curing family toxin [Alicyclobacillus fastidiosus]WAH44986.1 type II toxin-antitoxin system death-on-curing family toxin [Alicyclobacillus fastidiosus]GMA66271.1 death-on-curing protein [Alicyclobacillus fastidiosus]GMA66320.1 death-on-curing protein [Alicyclobacillus fastidiosus]